MTQEAIGPSFSRGVTSEQALAALARLGRNMLPAAPRPSFFRRFSRQFQNALIYLLLLALALDLASWLYAGHRAPPIEALAILGVLLLNAGLGVAQEYRSESALAELEKLGAPQVWAFRDAQLVRIEASELVPDDLVRLEAGDRVPADGIVQGAEALSVDESLLTGESLPVAKSEGAELFSGSLVVRGRTELVVSRTGARSTMGRLAQSLALIETTKTPLEQRIEQLGTRIAHYVGALSVLLIVGGVAAEGVARLSSVVMFAVALSVAIVPESMPAMMTLALAFGVQRMARRKAVVRRLSAVEALGSVTVIATDKTGTLTSNQIVVKALHSLHETDAVLALTLANDADHGGVAGDPLESGLLEFAKRRGADVQALRSAQPRIASHPFDSEWKCMRASVIAPDGTQRSYLKGAVELVLERCALTVAERSEWLQRAEAEARTGCKVLGLATGPGESETDLSFLGFVTLWDAPRPEAREAVLAAKQAGITVLMLTGDHSETARAIGEQVGIVSERLLTGSDVEQQSQAELQAALASVRVFARLLPEHKLRIVEALQANGEIVAMTGDGLNDTPALKRADVGVAMGERGSDVAREVADVVLLDDNFATIVAAVEEGRVIYENILSFIRFTSSSNVALMLLVLGGAFGSLVLGMRDGTGNLLLPLTALQLLWINFLGDGPPALALSVDRVSDVMQRPPRPRSSALLDRKTLTFTLSDGVFKAVVGLSLLVLLPRLGASLPATAAAVFLYEAVAKLASAYPARSVDSSPGTNVWLHVSIAAGIGLCLLCVTLEPLRRVLALHTTDASTLRVVACAVSLTVLGSELLARVLRRRAIACGLPKASAF